MLPPGSTVANKKAPAGFIPNLAGAISLKSDICGELHRQEQFALIKSYFTLGKLYIPDFGITTMLCPKIR